jgi:hypothetical protein
MKIKRLIEDGQNGRKNSSLDVQTEEINDEKKGKLLRYLSFTYRSYEGSNGEVSKLDLT